jgi:hypothetical protein
LWYDTTSVNGNFLKYHVVDNSVFIEYGNNSFHRSLPDKYDCQITDFWIPKFEWDTHDFMILKYGCGSPCWGIFVLRFDSLNPVRNIMYDMAFDYDNELIVYLGNMDYNSLIVENLKTLQRIKIEFPFKSDHGEFMGSWIDSISIKNNQLYYKYSNPNDYNEKKPHTEVTINIKLKKA